MQNGKSRRDSDGRAAATMANGMTLSIKN